MIVVILMLWVHRLEHLYGILDDFYGKCDRRIKLIIIYFDFI